ncbi:MAG: hypothetical protein EOO73_22410 [Myxococcales bacterium]|nr:MAG: hypothetical protein EOO73_22410 [Myxococcales bacterium]
MKATQALVTMALLFGAGCAQLPAGSTEEDRPELTPELKALVLESAPTDIPKPLYIDFNGKAELVGYSLEPATMAAPGSKLSLKLYWRSTSRLGSGYALFTEIVTGNGKRFEVEGAGPLRSGALSPGNWEPGKVYVDELDVTVPAELDSSRFSIVVGLRTAPVATEEAPAEDAKKDDKAGKDAAKPAAGQFGAVYLSVLSGPADSKHGGVIATLETGLTPGAQRARAAKDGKPMKRPLAPRPVSAKPRPTP